MAFARPKKREPVGEAELFEYAVGVLSRRMRTVRDLKRLMKARAHEGERGETDMDAVVGRLTELKYLSDDRFAQDYTRLRKENQGFGRRRVQQDLAMKGVGKEIAETTLAAAYDEADEVGLARAYCEKKRIPQPSGVDAQKQTVRVMNRLMRAGYSSSAIFKLFRAWKVEVPEGGDSDTYGEMPEF
ncbi:regulatory protein RecX [Granulicella tundricola]|uniref:Regulatory protein RecX n=1 Tax=Granulicella tundricola (strain ATCC BAA-1859 / DSM 23138 / MP5ACTX9) TaxID=1198114 RepID=E8WYL0_GRATM|nr:regulatory protein RecX [Granulicella tundricola]ADW67608.1 regulatory protein RecX [Granulicella tundricola MP5ACTX9]